MPPHNNQHSVTVSDLSLTDRDRFGSASSFDPRDCSSLNGRTIAVRKLQRLHVQKNSGLKLSSSSTSKCSRRNSLDSYDAEHLRRSLQSDEVISALTPPPPLPPPPRRPPNVQSKAAKENVERYKRLYDATLQDVLSVLKADDPSADIILPDPSAHAIVARSDENSHEDALERLREPPAIKRGLDAPLSPLKSDDFLPQPQPHTYIIARQQSQHSLSDDSTVVIDFENESHDIMSLLSDSNGGIPEDVFFPLANKIRSPPTSNFRQPRKDKDDAKMRRSKSGGDRRRQKVPSSAYISKPRNRPNGKKKRPESMQRQLQRQSSQSKSQFARSARGRSASPVNNDEGAAIAVSRSTESHYDKLRSMSPLRHSKSSSGAGKSLNCSSTVRRRSSSSSREGPRRRPSIAGSSSSNANCTSVKNRRSNEKKKGKLVKKMKLFASELKHRLDGSKKILSSGNASHIFKGGDVAEYRVGSRVSLEDLDYFIGDDGYTKMCAVRILEVGEDAVYKKPLYTILLPDGSKRQTTGNFLSPCSKQVTAESYRSRHQSALKLQPRNKSSSGSFPKRRSRSRSSESSNSSRHSNRSPTSPSTMTMTSSPIPKHRSRSRSSESTSSRHLNRLISSHRSSSPHMSSHRHSRRSYSPHKHKSKTRLNDNHCNGNGSNSNDRSSPRSKQLKHPSLPNAKSSNRTSMSRST